MPRQFSHTAKDRIFPPDTSLADDCRILDSFLANRSNSRERQTVSLSIGGLACSVTIPAHDAADPLEKRYNGFLADARTPAVRVDLSPRGSWSPYGDAGPGKYPEIACFADRDNLYVLRWDFALRFKVEDDSVLCEGFVPAPAHFFTHDAAVRIAYSLAAVLRKGLLVHSAGVLGRGGCAFLFPGRSGAGKTTLARVSKPVRTVFSDEMTLILPAGDGFTAGGTPFWGELGEGSGITAPLVGIYFIEQAPEPAVRPLQFKETARRLLGNVLFFGVDGPLVKKAFENALEVAGSVPGYELSFAPDTAFWEVIDG